VGDERAADIRGEDVKRLQREGRLPRDRSTPEATSFRREGSLAGFMEAFVGDLRQEGRRRCVLSEYVEEKRTPDAVLFDGKELVALEVELQKLWEPIEG
jgi:hypothetical protein